MVRLALGVVVGVIGWFVLVFLAGFVVRALWPAMAAITDMAAYTDPMRWTRLAIGAAAALASGLIASLVSRRGMHGGAIAGLVLVIIFIPVHAGVWDQFPVWYHLTFLISLVPLGIVGGMLVRAKPADTGRSAKGREAG